jgi:predicted amidohydrolase YtcJ
LYRSKPESKVKRRVFDGACLFCLVFLAFACSPQASQVQDIRAETIAPAFVVPDGKVADVIFHNGTVLTMEDVQPKSQAVALQGESILAVGSDADILTLSGQETRVIDLQGRTLVPGFIDSHAHRLMRWDESGYASMEEAAQDALANGWTSANELSVGRTLLNEIAALDRAGGLPLRVNIYLTLNYWPDIYGDWYQDYEPGSFYTPHLRIAGAKIFMDGNWGTTIWLTQDELDAMVTEVHQAGWQFAIHAVGETSTDMALDALELAMQEDTGLYRPRIEHAVFLRDDQIERMGAMRAIASIELNAVGNYSSQEGFQTLVVLRGRRRLAGRARDLLDAGVMTTGSTDAPYLYDESLANLEGAPFASPMRTIYQAITRTTHSGGPPERWMLDQVITAEEALELLTINGAHGTFEEDIKGSIAPGKLADLVILSDDPLAVSTDGLLDIEVLMTMVGGHVAYCAPGQDAFCPGN